MPKSIPVLGVTGFPGSGKSTFANDLCHLSGLLINADDLGHQILTRSAIVEQLCSVFGSDILNNGKICRKTLALKAFKDANTVKQLNSITHPPLRDLIHDTTRTPLPEGKSYYILEAAILFEAGFDSLCHLNIYLKTDFKTRLKRVQSRDWSEDDLKMRDQSQQESEKSKADLHLCGMHNYEDMHKKVLELNTLLCYNASNTLLADLRNTILGQVSEQGL